MGKKSKPPASTSAPPSTENATEPNPSSSSIFDKLFGAAPKADDSLFSDDNPFRRKKEEPLQKSLELQLPGNSGGAAEVKGKRTKQENEDREVLDAVLTVEAPKKLKKEKIEKQVAVIGNEVVEEEEEGLKKGKKKSKRDELEREYEKKLYGRGGGGEETGGGKKPQIVVIGKKKKQVDDPAEVMERKGEEEGFDDESKLLRTVFVGNLPVKMKKKALMKEFSQFGEVESVRIRSVAIVDSKTPRKGAILKKQINDKVDSVNAFIVFKTEESAQASLQHNMAVVGGNHVRVDRACPPRKKLKGESAPLYDNKRTVFVGNLPFDVKDEELYQLVCGTNPQESGVEAVRVVRDPHSSLGKGIAYVLFKTRDAAISVLKRRNLKLRDRELRMSIAKADVTPSKRKSPMSPGENTSSATKSGSPSGSNIRMKEKAPLSYQGLRASKSGAEKKSNPRLQPSNLSKPEPQSTEKKKVRTTKRPAVAARKAKALRAQGSATKQVGQKRKQEKGTPSSSHKHKKTKRF